MVKYAESSTARPLVERITPPREIERSHAGFNPLMPWLGMTAPLQIEYRMIEIRLGAGEARMRGERKTLRDGEIFEESIDAILPAELYLEAAERMQQQVQSMVGAMMMPWMAMMLPFRRF